MKYTRKQLIKGMKEYYEESVLCPDEFVEPSEPFTDAVNSIDYLIEIINRQK